jgi:ferredoxin-NADP reductase
VDGPHGSFVDRGDADGVVLVAGGIGIAPILSILRDAADRGDRRPFRMALAVRRRDDLAAAADLDDLSGRLDLVVHRFVEEGDPGAGVDAGRIGREGCARLLAGLDPSRTLAFACGPPGMMDTAVALLLDAGFPAGRIVTERFDYDAAGDPASLAVRRRFLSIVLAALAGVIAIAALMA